MKHIVAYGFFSHNKSRNGGVKTDQVTAENATKHGQISFWSHFLRFRFGDDFPNFDFDFLENGWINLHEIKRNEKITI